MRLLILGGTQFLGRHLVKHGVEPWMEVPLWIPATDEVREVLHMQDVSIDRAITAGLTFRSMVQTVEGTLAWDLNRPDPLQRRAGLDGQRERELLAQYMRFTAER